MSQIIIYPELFIEEIELNRMQRLLSNEGFRRMFVAVSSTFGVCKTNQNSLKVYESSSGKIGIKEGSAIDSDGNLIFLSEDKPDLFTLTNDNTFRKIFIQYTTTQIEKGTLQLNTNGSIIGTNTLFTQLFKPGKRIEIVNSTLNNNGTYEIVTVNSDTSLTTNATFTSESGVNFKVKGVYTPGASIPDNQSRPYFLDSVNITLESDSNNGNNKKFCLARVKLNGSTLTIEDKRDEQKHLFKESLITELTQSYTTSPNFYVDAEPGTGANGKKLLTADDIAPFALNTSGDVMSANVKNFQVRNLQPLKYGDRIQVDFSWGFHNIEGMTDGEEFVITHGYNSSTMDDITGQYLYIPNYGNFRINSFQNTNQDGETRITSLTPSGNSVYPQTTVILNSNNYGLIHSNHRKFILRAAPVIDNIESKDNIVLFSFDGEGSDIFGMNKCFLKLVNGMKYNIKLSLTKGNQYVEKNLPEGYLKIYEDNDVHYLYPWEILYPNIPDDGGVVAKDLGNKINFVISGWNDADDFEVVYTTSGEPDFNSDQQQKFVSANKNFDITVSPGIYKYAVRPRIGKLQVQTPKTGIVTIVSNFDGKPITDTILMQKVINTYSGSITNVSSMSSWGTYPMFAVTLSSIVTPSGGTNVPTRLNLRGLYLKDSQNHYFEIDPESSNNVSAGSCIINVIDTSGNNYTPANGNFQIGVDTNSRFVTQGIAKAPLTLMSIEANLDFAALGNSLIRVYNLNDITTYDTLLINMGMKGSASVVGSGNVNFNTGDTYVVTMYDAGNNKNTGCFSGTIKVVLGDNSIRSIPIDIVTRKY